MVYYIRNTMTARGVTFDNARFLRSFFCVCVRDNSKEGNPQMSYDVRFQESIILRNATEALKPGRGLYKVTASTESHLNRDHLAST